MCVNGWADELRGARFCWRDKCVEGAASGGAKGALGALPRSIGGSLAHAQQTTRVPQSMRRH